MSWKTLAFEDCLEKIKTPPKLQKSKYLSKGKFPVIAQEDSIINGYTNDENLVFKINSPIIIFGDHTRKLKYIDFDFVLGADGAKIIKPKSDINVKFFFYYLIQVMPKNIGYARHYKLLKKISFNIPSLPEQQRIVAKLDVAFSEIDKTILSKQKSIINLDKFFQTKIDTFFQDNSNSWEDTTLGKYYDVRDGTHDSPKYVDQGIPLVTSKNLKKGKIDLTKIKYIKNEDYLKIKKRSEVSVGDVLMAMIGTIGNPVIVEKDNNFAIKNVALFKIKQNQSSDFLKFYLSSSFVINKMIKEAKGTTQKFVGLGYLRDFPIKIPSYKKQKEISLKIKEIERNVEILNNKYNLNIHNYISLKNSLLSELLNKNKAA